MWLPASPPCLGGSFAGAGAGRARPRCRLGDATFPRKEPLCDSRWDPPWDGVLRAMGAG